MPEPSTTTSSPLTSCFDFFFPAGASVPVASATAVPTTDWFSSSPPTAATVASMRPVDQLVEAVAVTLLEGRALGLPVVGEDDDLVRARRVAARALDAAELLVELAQRLERVAALEPGVVRDLVVAGEGGVDGGAALEHVGDDGVHRQVADEHADAGADERVLHAAVAAREDVALRLARIAAVSSRKTSQKTSTSRRVTLKPLAKNGR